MSGISRETRCRALSRKEREREAHRREILDAAEKVFIARGYHTATVEQIAQEADFSVGTLYNFFKSKEEMYSKVLEKISIDFRADFDAQVVEEGDAVLALENLIRLRLSHFEAHRGFFRVFLETSPGITMDPLPALPSQVREMYLRYRMEVAEVFERGMGAGVFRRADALYLTLCLEGITNAAAAYWAQYGTDETLDVRIEKLREAFFRWVEAVSPAAAAGEAE